ncbi:MAG: VCBS repeat-containing protein [Cyanobacteria bacterium J06648_11]
MHFVSSKRLILVLLAVQWSLAQGGDEVQLWNLEFVAKQFPVADGEKALAVADINDDGSNDLVVLHSQLNEAVVHLGDGDGGIQQQGRFPAGQAPAHATITDIDADGYVDLVIANHNTSYLTILLGDGNGAFDPAANSPLLIGVDPHVHVAYSFDIDSDDISDLIADSRDERGLTFLKGHGDGTFAVPGKLIEMGGDPYLGIAIGDIDGDGRPDLLSPNEHSIGVAIKTSSDEMSFRLAQPLSIETPFALALADIDADGFLDLVTASDGRSSVVRVLTGDGRGKFESWGVPIPIPRGAKRIAVGDIDGDGGADVLVTAWSSSEVVIISERDGLDIARMSVVGIENPWGAVIADMNGDGLGDLVVADGIKSAAIIYMSRSGLE